MELAELLAQNNFGDTRSGSLAGPVGAFLVAVLAVTTVLLIRNMNSRIRRLPERFPGPPPGPPPAERDIPGAPGRDDAAPRPPGRPGDEPDRPARHPE